MEPGVLGWRRLDRGLQRVAFRLTAGQFTALAGGPLVRRSATAARVFTLAAAVVLLTGIIGVAALGLWLVLLDFFSLSTVLGAILLGVAFMLRPRLGRLADLTDEAVEIEPDEAPALHALVERVAQAIGAPMPHVLLLSSDLNAFTTTVGFRRHRVLCLGLPLWATLDPQERVALLGHELGHFVNGDVRRGLLTQIAENTLGRIADLFNAEDTNEGGLIGMVTKAAGWTISRTALALHLLLVWTSQRDSQRAEYLADELGARAGGSAATIRLADHLLIATALDTVIRRESRAGNGPSAWRAAAVIARTNLAPDIALLRQLSRHTTVSLFASHPPSGMRADMLERRPALPAAVTLTEPVSARIDDELADNHQWVVRELAYSD